MHLGERRKILNYATIPDNRGLSRFLLMLLIFYKSLFGRIETNNLRLHDEEWGNELEVKRVGQC